MKYLRLSLILLVSGFFALLVCNSSVSALDVPPVPTDVPIVDQTNTLTGEQKAALAQKIASERAATGNQTGVLMISSLQGEALEDYSLDVARTWGIGQKDRNSGVLLLIAKDDRKLRIEVGYGLEGALTDVQSSRIIRNQITPQFRAGNYYAGIDAGIDGIISAIHGEADPNASEDAGAPAGFPWELVLFVGLFGFSWLGSILARTKSWWAGGVIGGVAGGVVGMLLSSLFIGIAGAVGLALLGLLLDKAVSGNYQKRAGNGDKPSWWAGGGFLGGGGSSNGGFGGFSGGGFGGGGSSGSW